jgi:hypothetical protein
MGDIYGVLTVLRPTASACSIDSGFGEAFVAGGSGVLVIDIGVENMSGNREPALPQKLNLTRRN